MSTKTLSKGAQIELETATIVGLVASLGFAGYGLALNLKKAKELKADDTADAAVAEFPTTFKEGKRVQVPLACAATGAGLLGLALTGNPLFAEGALLAAAPVAWTATAMKPTIDELHAEAEKPASGRDKDKGRKLLRKWNLLHAARTASAAAAAGVFGFLLYKQLK